MKTARFAPVTALAALALVLPARAAQPGDIAVGGTTLLTIKASVNGQTPEQRAQTVTDRLPVILGLHRLTPDDIRLKKIDGQDTAILVRGRLLITVTAADAAVNQLTVPQQAKIWAGQLKQTIPQVSAKPNPNNMDASAPSPAQ
jgi:hypothetical protein